MTGKGLIGAGLGLVLAGAARAECTGENCYDGLMQLFQAILAYGLIGLVLLVLLIVPPWRKTGLRGLLLVAGLAVGVPAVSMAWQRVQLWWMERGEVLRELPPMTARTPLLIAPNWSCLEDPCAALLMGRGNLGAYALPVEALDGRDMAAPLVLADLPLELWSEGEGIDPRRRQLSPAERAEAVARIDYLILAQRPFHLSEYGPLEAGLELGQKVRLRLAMAKLTAGTAVLDLQALEFDLFDLTATHMALAIPLAPGNWQSVWSDPLDPERVARSLCGKGQAEPDWSCLDAAGR